MHPVSPRNFLSVSVHRALATLAAVALVAMPQTSSARPSMPVLQQVTNITVGTVEDVRLRLQQGARISFASDGDVMGPGTETNDLEIYVYDAETKELMKATNTPGGRSYQPARSTDQVFQADRTEIVAFISTGDLDPEVGNGDGNPEIFFWELVSGKVTQITDTQPPVVNSDPFPSDSGKCMVFSSTGDIENNSGEHSGNPSSGYNNEDGSQEVFLWSVNELGAFPVRRRGHPGQQRPGGHDQPSASDRWILVPAPVPVHGLHIRPSAAGRRRRG